MAGLRIVADKDAIIRDPRRLARLISIEADRAVCNQEMEEGHYFRRDVLFIHKKAILRFKSALLSEGRYQVLDRESVQLEPEFCQAFDNVDDEYLICVSKGLKASILLTADSAVIESRNCDECKKYYEAVPKLKVLRPAEYPLPIA
jgi:hypothetical protein